MKDGGCDSLADLLISPILLAAIARHVGERTEGGVDRSALSPGPPSHRGSMSLNVVACAVAAQAYHRRSDHIPCPCPKSVIWRRMSILLGGCCEAAI